MAVQLGSWAFRLSFVVFLLVPLVSHRPSDSKSVYLGISDLPENQAYRISVIYSNLEVPEKILMDVNKHDVLHKGELAGCSRWEM